MSTDTTQTPKKRRWLLPLLIVSLALNLLFVGLMAGAYWKKGGPGGRSRIITGAVEKLMQDLPEPKRQLAAGLVKTHKDTVLSVRKQFREARRNSREAILTEPYDEAKVAAALSRFRELRAESHQSMHTMILGLTKELTLKERKQLIDNIRSGFRKRWGRWRRHEDKKQESGQNK